MTEISYQILMMLTCQKFECLKYFPVTAVKPCLCVFIAVAMYLIRFIFLLC